MSDLICRKTMMRCPTPGTCSPHGGCQSQHDRDSSELRRLCAERDQLRTANQRLEGEVARMREALEHARLFIRNGIDLGCIRMPDADTPDPAHHTLPLINAALSTTNDEVTE